MKESIQLKQRFSVLPKVIYNAWLCSEEHSKMTGGMAVCNRLEGHDFSAWDDYISGKNLKLKENSRIVQSWRSTEFNEKEEDSFLEIKLEETKEGTELTLLHSNIPEGQSEHYKNGWIEYYFEPMNAYFKEKKTEKD